MSKIVRALCPAVPPERLATLRILVGLYGVIYLLARAPGMMSVLHYRPQQFAPVGLAWWMRAPLDPWAVVAGLLATLACGAAFVAGWRFRVCGPAYAVGLLGLTSYRNSWGMVFHTENLLVLHTCVLGLAASADAWSFDARGRGGLQDSPRYGWAVGLMGWVTALTYVLAGHAKLAQSGFGWVTSDTLRNLIAYDNIRKAELGAGYSAVGTWMVSHAWVFPPLAGLSLGVELLAPLAVVHRKVAAAWAVAAWGFHAGVVLLMFIFFPYPILGLAYAPFFPVERLGRWVLRRFEARAALSPSSAAAR